MVVSCTNVFRPKCFLTKPTVTKTVEELGRNLICFAANKRESRLPAVASIFCPPIDANSLETEFGGNGVTFTDMGDDSTIVKMSLENGSVAKLLLPSGLITSYKPLMWHGGTVELLHTSVSEGENGGAVVHGGVSLAFTCDDSQGNSWSPTNWILRSVKRNPQESIQVELSSKNVQGDVEVKHVITLSEDYLGSEIIFRNSSDSSLKLMGSTVSHLTVSTPEATYAIGLEGSDYFNKPPVATDFSLLPPGFGKRSSQSSPKGPLNLVGFFTSWGGSRNQKHGDDPAEMMEETMEGEEDDNYKRLEEEMSKIYINAPRSFTIIDRGRRNSIVVRREGFNELYMLSPGSSHEWYGKYAYICVGQAAMQQPLTLDSHSKWKGEQYLCNPNL